MRNFILNHASLAFWIWCVPPFLWLLSTLPAEASLEERISALLLTWTWMLLGGAAINWYSRLLLWRAVKYMDNHCDPEPLLELCSTVCRQNPSNMIFHVYQGYALSLLGRHQEAIQVLEHVAEHRKLVKNASALLIWSAALPSGDPRQEWVAEKLTALKPKMRAKQRALVDRVMHQRRSFALMQAAPPQLEPLLQQDLERAECLREKVGAHMALAVYCYQREKWQQAQMHLEFVLDNANKLHVRTQAEELLCKLPSAFLQESGGGFLTDFGDGLHAQAAAQAAGVIDAAELQTGAQGIHHIHQPGLHRPGQRSAQGPHMGEDNIPLLVAQVCELLGIAGGGPGMVKALPARVGRLVTGVVEVQIVQESASGGSGLVQAQSPGGAERPVSHKQGVVQGGDAVMMAPAAHHPYLFRA